MNWCNQLLENDSMTNFIVFFFTFKSIWIWVKTNGILMRNPTAVPYLWTNIEFL